MGFPFVKAGGHPGSGRWMQEGKGGGRCEGSGPGGQLRLKLSWVKVLTGSYCPDPSSALWPPGWCTRDLCGWRVLLQ